MTFAFDPHTHIKRVYIVGVGGTGCGVARLTARILYDMNRRRQHLPELVLVDPDEVEEANVGRQALFLPADIGTPKATRMARRLSAAFGLAVRAIPAAFDPERHTDRYGSNLIVSCVDNHQARQAIHRARGVFIQGGNAHQSGQICIGNSHDIEQVLNPSNWRDGRVRYLPTEGLLFPELLEPEPVANAPTLPPDASCTARIANGTQHLLVNDWMCIVMGNLIYKVLHRKPIYTFLTFIDADVGTVIGKDITRDTVLAYLHAE